MLIKLTNCTVFTGGGKIPFRLRHNQNVRVNLPTSCMKFNDFELKEISMELSKLKFITTSTTKVVRCPKSNSKLKVERVVKSQINV